jgi:hypothetical protein
MSVKATEGNLTLSNPAHPEELKRTFLHFLSSELTAHAASIVGLSVLLLTCINVFTREGFLPKIQFPAQLIISKITFDYVIIFLTFWLLCTGVFYSFMRLTYYGALAHQIVTLAGFTPANLETLHTYVVNQIAGKEVIGWFSGGISLKARGFWLSVVVGFMISVIQFLVLFVK